MQFDYFGGEQRTPEWFKLRLGKPTASRLIDWLSVSKAKTGAGKPLKARLDYEKELIFERTFGVSFENYINSAMQDGIDFEAFAIEQYSAITSNKVVAVGAWYNEFFLASPDGGVGDEGLVECKVLKDNSFTEVLVSGVPDKHWKQMQGQLFASKRQWNDYVAINLSTKKIKIIRVMPDPEFYEYLELALQEKLVTADFDKDGLYDFVGTAPEGGPLVETDYSDTNITGF